ncbi:hypothetical protein BU16DRAFT_560377 [Lophium mytilinum]|uniref:Uncharacterized protein n=1 Tax=Lophium mytilinum TaxID=390894 RepID=A0A6A6QYA9_9PEZI|nr:hypothetical protein BU16DRAFT_560377 [Lophium mytilinum]
MHLPLPPLFLITLLPTLSLTAPTFTTLINSSAEDSSHFLHTLRLQKRTVTTLDPAAFAEAQVRDPTATRAFTSTTITTTTGLCLSVDELSGDFRANLTPVPAAACDGSAGQSWDIITAGKHNDQPGTMIVVSTLTQACLNFDPRRAAGNQVLLFSCGGRADGGGAVTDSQLFAFDGGAGPLALRPENAAGTCLTIAGGKALDQAACVAGEVAQSFTFGGQGVSAPAPGNGTGACS